MIIRINKCNVVSIQSTVTHKKIIMSITFKMDSTVTHNDNKINKCVILTTKVL